MVYTLRKVYTISGGTTMPEKKFTPAEVAELLGISKKTLYAWEKSGKMPFHPERDIRGWRLFSQKEVDWLKTNVRSLLTVIRKKER